MTRQTDGYDFVLWDFEHILKNPQLRAYCLLHSFKYLVCFVFRRFEAKVVSLALTIVPIEGCCTKCFSQQLKLKDRTIRPKTCDSTHQE